MPEYLYIQEAGKQVWCGVCACICVCMRACMNVCVCTSSRASGHGIIMHVALGRRNVCIRSSKTEVQCIELGECGCECVCMFVYVCEYVCARMRVCVSMCVYIYVCVCVSMYVSICVCVCVRVRMPYQFLCPIAHSLPNCKMCAETAPYARTSGRGPVHTL
jgi:hypothetical protein